MRFPTYEVFLAGESVGSIDIDLMLDELEVLEQRAGLTWKDWIEQLETSSAAALRFTYWLAKHRAGADKGLKFSDINFRRSELTVKMTDEGDFGDEDEAAEEDADADRPTGSGPTTDEVEA